MKLVSGSDGPLVERETKNLEAYNLYLKGQYHWRKMTPEALKTARECYRRAIEIDPQYASPHAGIANTYIIGSYWEGIPAMEAYPKARQAAEAALAINDSEAEAVGALATVHVNYDLDLSEAERRFQQALELVIHVAAAVMPTRRLLGVVFLDDLLGVAVAAAEGTGFDAAAGDEGH